MKSSTHGPLTVALVLLWFIGIAVSAYCMTRQPVDYLRIWNGEIAP